MKTYHAQEKQEALDSLLHERNVMVDRIKELEAGKHSPWDTDHRAEVTAQSIRANQAIYIAELERKLSTALKPRTYHLQWLVNLLEKNP